MKPITLLMLVASVVAREYTDEDRANFPNLFHLDEYERCLTRVDGVYCLGTFELTPAKQPHATYELMKAYSDDSYQHFNRTRIHRGYCLSMRCATLATSYNSWPAIESNASLLFERCADHYAQRSELRASLHTLHYCRTHADSITIQPPTTAEHIFKLVICALVVANIVGTVYDNYAEDTPNKNKLLSAFSIPANWRRLTFIRKGGDPRQTALDPLEGFRVIALGFTTYAHASVLHYTFHTINPEFLERMTQRFDGVFLASGTSLIQGFVMMSCFLTGYNLLIYSQEQELGLHLLPLCIIKRVIRITPVHLLIVGYGATWWLNSRDGPLVPTTIDLESEACKTKFWSHVFFLNNIVDASNYCVLPTWVIALGFTTYAHASVLHYTFHTINPEFLERMTQRFDGVFLASGTSLIQGFVMMSCFLTGYNLLIYSQEQELGLHLLPLCIIKRVIRITPVHLLIVGYGATWWLNSRDGPLVPTTIDLESEACKTKFWSHVFFLNNIVDASNYCVLPTWFLSVIMHMYILACTFTLLLWRRRWLAVSLYTVLFIASCLLTAVIVYIKDYKSIINVSTPEQIRNLYRETPSVTEFYISSWGALPACFLGLILAHIQFELDERKIKLSEYKWFVYLHYTCWPLLSVWSLTGMFTRGQHSAVFNAVYTALDRTFFCILLGLGLMGLFHVNGPIKRFFSWSPWRSLGRMSLTVMLLHWCINMTIGTRPIAYGTSILDILVDWSGTILITYAVAVPITILVEFPMQKFFEELFFKGF